MKTFLALPLLVLVSTVYEASAGLQHYSGQVRIPTYTFKRPAPQFQARMHQYSGKIRSEISTLKNLSPQTRAGIRKSIGLMRRAVSMLTKLTRQSWARMDGDKCAIDCANNEWQPGTGQVSEAYMDPFPGLMDSEQVGKVCGVYDKTKTCLDKCPASAGKNGVVQGFGLAEYMCKKSNYKQYAHCICEAAQGAEATCDGDTKCGKYKKVINGPEPTDEQTLKDFMKNMCQYMTCNTECLKPTIEQKCTLAAFTAIRGMPAAGAKILKALCDAHGVPQLYPQECRTIAA